MYISCTTDATDLEAQEFNFFEYPASLSRKVLLLQHFKSYIEGNKKFQPITQFDFTKPYIPKF